MVSRRIDIGPEQLHASGGHELPAGTALRSELDAEPDRPRLRTCWISDLHLGTRGANAAAVREFLKSYEFDKLYLVGDLIDIWKLRRSRYWPQSHTDVLQRIMKLARKGTRVIFIPGNHDDFCVNFLGSFGNIEIRENDIHETADGRRLLVLHGHEFDAVTTHARWVAVLGDIAYGVLLHINRWFNWLRMWFGWGYWSLSAYIKAKVKDAVNLVSNFESAVARYAHMHEADGIVCGHIHTAAIRSMQGVSYYNCGDWVESATALIEHQNGRIELIYWLKDRAPCSESPANVQVAVGEPAEPVAASGASPVESHASA